MCYSNDKRNGFDTCYWANGWVPPFLPHTDRTRTSRLDPIFAVFIRVCKIRSLYCRTDPTGLTCAQEPCHTDYFGVSRSFHPAIIIFASLGCVL